MEKKSFEIPVVLIIFNRPYFVEKQMDRLRQVRPNKLFIVSDAARADKKDELEQVERSRSFAEKIDWKCDVKKIYATENMGCDARIVSGLNEVFSKVEMAIILEDDCLPCVSFFSFCEKLLLKYQFNDNVMYISGTKWAPQYPMKYSYGFSYNTSTWGWATWRRSWKEWHWDRNEWNEKKNEWLKGIYSLKYRKSLIRDMECYFSQKNVPWDYVWRFCVGKRLSVFPAVNMIENIGFGEQSTHTKEEMYGYISTTQEMEEIVHPPLIEEDLGYPYAIERQMKIPLWYRIKRKICRFICEK